MKYYLLNTETGDVKEVDPVYEAVNDLEDGEVMINEDVLERIHEQIEGIWATRFLTRRAAGVLLSLTWKE